ncbi:hypothetical protein NPIL_403441 [Nephila pilipes]|uniref:Uncharacterized protein n=1 Tax=Nephila pilipes TaxID=299642 RepID=A0A8X6U1K5_NEPPI|nr:hypothetical protein NPIL_403441 [Nephila pilipes]
MISIGEALQICKYVSQIHGTMCRITVSLRNKLLFPHILHRTSPGPPFIKFRGAAEDLPFLFRHLEKMDKFSDMEVAESSISTAHYRSSHHKLPPYLFSYSLPKYRNSFLLKSRCWI